MTHLSRPSRPLFGRALGAMLAASIGAVLALAPAGDVRAQADPKADARPVRILVGFPPGGGSDLVARILADKLKDALGTAVVVENRPGAGGQLAAQALKAAPADGHTLFLSHDHTISILPQVMANAGYDPAKDFVPVAGLASFVNALALSGGNPATDFKGWIANARASKGVVGIPAPASTPEFLVKRIATDYQLDLAAAPYRGSAPMMADMAGNQIPAGVGSVPDFIEFHKAGKLRVVMVLGKARQAALPDVPSSTELGLKGFEDLPYYGLFAPAGTPAAVIDKTAAAVRGALAMPDVSRRLTEMGLAVQYMTPAELGAREGAYAKAWGEIIRASGFKAQ